MRSRARPDVSKTRGVRVLCARRLVPIERLNPLSQQRRETRVKSGKASWATGHLEQGLVQEKGRLLCSYRDALRKHDACVCVCVAGASCALARLVACGVRAAELRDGDPRRNGPAASSRAYYYYCTTSHTDHPVQGTPLCGRAYYYYCTTSHTSTRVPCTRYPFVRPGIPTCAEKPLARPDTDSSAQTRASPPECSCPRQLGPPLLPPSGHCASPTAKTIPLGRL